MRTRKNQIVNEAYSTHSGDTWRKEFDLILDMVEASSSILDLGCGDGTLDRELMVRKNCKVCGLDMSEVAVKYARRKGIDAKIGYLKKF
jgi:2-polyprenyl-3-methyl-5-hydroxy-6-metoxy-1,4-benzoquinol methylase